MSQISSMNGLEIAPRFRHQGGVRGHAVEEAQRGQLTDLGDIGRIDEEFHGYSSRGPAATALGSPPDGG
jgi:hypothetical protein